MKDSDHNVFGEYVRKRREKLNKSLRGLAKELDIAPAYLSDIEKGNRYAPEKYLDIMIEKLEISGDELNTFYDLAGKSRNNNYPDLSEYIGSSDLARVALRKARDYRITDEQWQQFIDDITDRPE